MNSNLFGILTSFWEVKPQPKHSLHRVDENEVSLKKANRFYIATVFILFFFSVAMTLGGVL